ncbi:hypothetical protein APHCRT_0705 [Anaplasma phagocytophilum str. CRT53-1]|uniref:Uncharacterized protein n=1 Tax=Anaplasma phagocytophilum str. CRT53-1 TaxID=1359157 RepID=A0A0F3Q206_ANAPH|nr:hypothetical protein APHCRT_0705 [Anaplasma phagocytophilum str. CRT53-1]
MARSRVCGVEPARWASGHTYVSVGFCGNIESVTNNSVFSCKYAID